MQVELFEDNQGIIKKLTNICNIKGVSVDCYILAGQKYKAFCAIFYHGTSMHAGHYTCMIRKRKRWMHINDSTVQKK